MRENEKILDIVEVGNDIRVFFFRVSHIEKLRIKVFVPQMILQESRRNIFDPAQKKARSTA